MPFVADTDALIRVALQRTAAEQRCVVDPHSTDVTVCGLRNADRFRVPFTVRDPDDPRYRGVPAEREALLYRTNAIQDMSMFLVNTGHVGARVTTSFGGSGAGEVRVRKPAP